MGPGGGWGVGVGQTWGRLGVLGQFGVWPGRCRRAGGSGVTGGGWPVPATHRPLRGGRCCRLGRGSLPAQGPGSSRDTPPHTHPGVPPAPRLRAVPWTLLRCLLPAPPCTPRWLHSSGTLGRYPTLCHSSPHLPHAMADPPTLKPLVAVGQVTSTPDKELNFAVCAGLVREAAHRRACLVFLPEGFDYIGSNTAQTLSLAEGLDGDLIGRYAELAKYQWGPPHGVAETEPLVLAAGLLAEPG